MSFVPKVTLNTTLFRGDHDQEVRLLVPCNTSDSLIQIMDKAKRVKDLAGGETDFSLTDVIEIRFEPRLDNEPTKL